MYAVHVFSGFSIVWDRGNLCSSTFFTKKPYILNNMNLMPSDTPKRKDNCWYFDVVLLCWLVLSQIPQNPTLYSRCILELANASILSFFISYVLLFSSSFSCSFDFYLYFIFLSFYFFFAFYFFSFPFSLCPVTFFCPLFSLLFLFYFLFWVLFVSYILLFCFLLCCLSLSMKLP